MKNIQNIVYAFHFNLHLYSSTLIIKINFNRVYIILVSLEKFQVPCCDNYANVRDV